MSKANEMTSQADTVAMLPCPFCGSSDLSNNDWWLEEDGEVDAVECRQCFAGAPVKTWNQRHSDRSA